MPLSVFIPYFDDDDGKRPMAAQLPMYACENIQPNGIKGNTYPGRGPANTFKTNVKVRVRGLSSPTQIVMMVFYNLYGTISWSKLEHFGRPLPQARLNVTGDGDYILSIEGWIDVAAPEHICMVALAWSNDEFNPDLQEPAQGSNKHWAQLNLADVSTKNACGQERFEISFNVGNPSEGSDRYLLRAQVAGGSEINALRALTGEPLLEPTDVTFAFHDIGTGATSAPSGIAQSMSVDLTPREDRPFSLFGSIGPSLKPGDCFAISINQYAGSEPEPEGRVGGCVVLITVSS